MSAATLSNEHFFQRAANALSKPVRFVKKYPATLQMFGITAAAAYGAEFGMRGTIWGLVTGSGISVITGIFRKGGLPSAMLSVLPLCAAGGLNFVWDLTYNATKDSAIDHVRDKAVAALIETGHPVSVSEKMTLPSDFSWTRHEVVTSEAKFKDPTRNTGAFREVTVDGYDMVCQVVPNGKGGYKVISAYDKAPSFNPN